MTKFTFRLESILSIKLKLEEQAKMEFGAAKMKLSEEQDKLEGLYNKKSGYENDLKKLYSENLDIKRINATADLATQKLNTVMQERKSMEKKKKKRFAEYMREYNEEESKQTDELISYQYGRVEE